MSLGLTVLYLILNFTDQWLPWSFHPYFIGVVIFFFIQSLGISWILSVAEKDKERFPLLALGSVVLRFVTGVLLLVVFFIIGLVNPEVLVIQFMIVYLSYMIFELTIVLANLRRN